MNNPMDFAAFSARYGLRLNESQQAAARRIQGHTLLLAVPGSGKTAVIVARAGYLIGGCGVAPGSILTMSYGVAAVQDLRNRFSAQFGAAFPAPAFRTVHGFCTTVLADYARLTGKTLFHLMSAPGEIARFMDQVFLELTGVHMTEIQMHEMQRAMSFAHNRMLTDAEIGRIPAPFDPLRFFSAYTEKKIAHRVMDYDDLLVYAFRALSAHPNLRAGYQRRFPHIQIDEAQDISLLQHKIIAAVAQPGNLLMVGDEDQSIYGFRAADPAFLISFPAHYPDARVMTLEQNYRSTPEIVRAAANVIARNRTRHPKHMFTALPSGPAPQRICVPDRIGQYARLESLAVSAKGTTAILYRNNDSALPIIDLFTAHGIPFFCREHDTSYFDLPKIADICDVLRFAHAMADEALFRKVYYKLGVRIPRTAMEQTIRLHAKNPQKDLPTVMMEAELLDETETVRLRTQYRLLKRIARMKTFDAIVGIRRDTQFGKRFSAYSDARLEPLLALAAQNPDPQQFCDRLHMLRTQVVQGTGNTDASITLSTIHSAKGQEFDRVILIDAYEGVLPAALPPEEALQSTAQQTEEERRLFYVGVTRARRELLVFLYGNGKNRVPAPFVAELFRDPSTDPPPEDAFRPGVRIVHRRFGAGTITQRKKQTLYVRFDASSAKTLDVRVCLAAGLLELEK